MTAIHDVAMTTLLAIGLLVGFGTPDFIPNYADRLTAPVAGFDARARLFPARRNNPVLVSVIPDRDYVTDERLSLLKSACEAWAKATRGEPREFTFEYIEAFGPRHPDVVFKLGAEMAEPNNYGLTVEEGGWASIRLAVVDKRGKPLDFQFALRVATHEVGHALGIWGHSPDASDMMSLSETSSAITRADVNTLELAYLLPPRP